MGDVKNFRFKTSRGNYDIPVKDTTARERIGDLDELHTQHKDNLVNAINDLDGGGGGTTDYNDLNNKPSINGVALVGNKTTSDLGIEGVTDYDELENKPTINGVELEGELSTEDLEIEYDYILNRPVESGDLDIDAVVDPLPVVVSKSNVVFDERGTEYEDGIYIKEIDGTTMYKPVYKKNVAVPITSNSSWNSTNHNISNISEICSIKMICHRNEQAIPTYATGASSAGNKDAYASTSMVGIYVADANVLNTTGYVTIEYTKTTDEWQEYEEDTP